MKILILLLSVGIASNTLFSQAWIKPKGSGYTQLGYSYIQASKIYGIKNIEEQLLHPSLQGKLINTNKLKLIKVNVIKSIRSKWVKS